MNRVWDFQAEQVASDTLPWNRLAPWNSKGRRKKYFGEHEKNRHSVELHALRKHMVWRIENNAIPVIVEHPHELLAFVVTFATHAEIVTSAIDHEGLENVAIIRGR